MGCFSVWLLESVVKQNGCGLGWAGLHHELVHMPLQASSSETRLGSRKAGLAKTKNCQWDTCFTGCISLHYFSVLFIYFCFCCVDVALFLRASEVLFPPSCTVHFSSVRAFFCSSLSKVVDGPIIKSADTVQCHSRFVTLCLSYLSVILLHPLQRSTESTPPSHMWWEDSHSMFKYLMMIARANKCLHSSLYIQVWDPVLL